MLGRGQVMAGARWLARLSGSRQRLASMVTSQARSVTSHPAPEIRREGDDMVSCLGENKPMEHIIYKYLEQAAARWSHHTALECGVTGQTYSYGALLDAWRRCGGALQRRGIKYGDVVCMLMLNSPAFGVVFPGVFAAGAVPSPINSTYTAGEVARQIQNSGAKMLVVDARLAGIGEAAMDLLPHPRPALVLAGGTDGGREDLLAEAEDKGTPFAEDVKVRDEDPSVIFYSSGTTGLPKGAPTRHISIKHNVPAVLHERVNTYTPATGEWQETVIGMMPFFHAFGIYTVLMSSLLHGVKVVTLPAFVPDLFLDILKEHKIGILHVVPPLLQFLVAHPSVTSDDLASLKTVMCAAAPCPAQAAHALKEKAPNPIFFQETYGMTESMPALATPLGHERLGSCGHILPGVRARVMDLTSATPVGPNTKGELWIKSPGVMKSYLNNPEATKEILTEDGWLKTGDVVTYDEDGYIYVVDRIKELIKVKGFQVSPTELEVELLQLPGVAEAGVVGVKDDRAGEVPLAFIVRRDPSLTPEKVHEFLRPRVAPHKQLAGGVRFVEELPKNPTGKLLRRQLQQQAEEEG